MTGPDLAREALSTLAARLARGDLDEETYLRQRELVLSNLTPVERGALGLTPAPATPAPSFGATGAGTPPPFSPVPLGPTGGKGKGVATRVASLSDLDLRPGTVLLEQWRVERELGRGGFGVVVEAEDLTLRERQAVKVLDPAMLAREDLLERFRREVKATRRLVHPRIVRVFDYRESLAEGLAFFSMELVQGCSVQLLLAAAREARRPVPVPLALSILVGALEALEAAHAQGVIHRDVTPANVLLAGHTARELLLEPGREVQVKLVDFGISGALDRSELSQKSRVLGTAAYVAPEVLDPRADVTPAADVYGAGAVLYELLTGEAPLGRFDDPARFRADVEPGLNDLALSLLQRQPARRPTAARARDLAAALLSESRLRRGAGRSRAEGAAGAVDGIGEAEPRREEEARRIARARVARSTTPPPLMPPLPPRPPTLPPAAIPPLMRTVPPAAVPMPPRTPAVVPPPQAAPASPEAPSRLVPYRNSTAISAYYLGVFSLVCLAFLGLPALFLGLRGLRYAELHPEAGGKVHAWVGIVCGALSIVLSFVVVALVTSL